MNSPTEYAVIRYRHLLYNPVVASVVATTPDLAKARELAAALDAQPDDRGLIALSYGEISPEEGGVAEIVHTIPDCDLWLAIELAGCVDAATDEALAWATAHEVPAAGDACGHWIHANDDAFTDVAGLIRAETSLELIGSDDGTLYLVRPTA